ncbi:MAG: hypothetical protein KIS80_01785 [Anaerolineales bacterium]|nr:hypothetical protein [Anaerolineales bacterium]
MQGRIFHRLAKKHLLPHLPGFTAKKGLIYVADFNYFLKGLAVDSSAFSKTTFTIWAFILPLFVPKEYISFTYGDRLGSLSGGGDKWWEYSSENEEAIFKDILSHIQIEALPFFNEVVTPWDFWQKYKEKIKPNSGDYQREACAYALVLAGEYEMAATLLEESIAVLEIATKEDPTIPWIGWILERVRKIDSLLAEDPQKAVAQLDEWTQETLKNLGLEAQA